MTDSIYYLRLLAARPSSANYDEPILPLVYTVGDEAFLTCHGSTIPGPNQTVTWTKSEGELPVGSRVEQGVLIVPTVHKNDEGSYVCEIKHDTILEETEDSEDPIPNVSVSTINLQIDDFIPQIVGEPIELPPLTDEELKSFDVELTLNTSVPKGVIFETRRVNSGDLLADPTNIILHQARINDDGTIRYEYDVGFGKEVIETTNSYNPEEWNVIRIKNDRNKVTIQLNDEPATIRQHSNPLPHLQTGVNRPLYIGGRMDPASEDDDFEGIISQVVLSGQNVVLGEARIPTSVVKYDACAKSNLCLNGARCRNVNNNKGFDCECDEKYHGEYCQWKSSRCHEENCNSGTCLDNEESWQCVCPVGTSGLRCEEKVPIPNPIGFSSDTSFLAVKRPAKFESIKMRLRPKSDSDEHILMYFATDYGSNTKQYASLSLIDNQVVFTLRKPNKEVERIRSEKLEAGKDIDLSVAQNTNDNTIVMSINGNEVSAIDSPTLRPGTEIFIGGLPPGLSSPVDVVERSFQGCVYEIMINSEDVDLENLSSSGDISSCEAEEPEEEPILTTEEPESEEEEEEESTTTTTTTEEPTTTTEEPTTTTTEEPTTTTTTEEPTTTTTEEPTTTTTEETYNFYQTSKDNEPVVIVPPPSTPSTTEIAVILPTDSQDDYFEDDEVEDEKVEEFSSSTVPPNTVTSPDDASDGLFDSEEQPLDCEGPSCDVIIPSTVEEAEDLSAVCNSTVCGTNGVCVPQNKTHYECRCKLYYDGPTCSLFKPIEHAARFDGDAFIELSSDEFPHLTSEKDEIVSFKFKTTQQNGVLLWQGQRPTVTQMEDYISVGIVNGHLHYSYELGGGAAHLISEERVDDGKEHYAKFERRGRRGLMKVDNLNEVHGMSTGILAMLNVDGNIFIGGIPSISKATGGIFSKNFVGCIADVELNGVRLDLMATAIDGKNVKPCDEWMQRKRYLYRRRVR